MIDPLGRIFFGSKSNENCWQASERWGADRFGIRDPGGVIGTDSHLVTFQVGEIQPE
jgi:hypothetical protein